MRIPKPVRIAGIALAILVILVVMFVSAFVFNPFEGRVTDMRDIVPRNIDFFVRKTDLERDLVELPEPVFWKDLAETNAWRRIERGPTVQQLMRDGLGQTLEQLRTTARQIADDSGGFVDLTRDVLGTELIVAGRLKPPATTASEWCVLTRVTWRIRFLWGLLQWGNVRSMLAEQGLSLEPTPERASELVLSGGQLREPLRIARIRDVLLISNAPDLVDASYQLSLGYTEDVEAFGGSSDYRDDIEARQREWQQTIGVESLNAVEAWIRPDRLADAMRWSGEWPNPAAPDINERMLASFIEQDGWRFLTATTAFDPAGLTMLGKIELDPNRHTQFQSEFFQSEAQDRRDWLDPFLTLVPQDAIAAAALRVPATAFLKQMYLALDDPTRELLDDAVKRTGKYDSTLQLIDSIGLAFLPRMGFVFERAVKAQDPLPTNEPSRLPHIAWVFWLQPAMRPRLDEFQEFLFQQHRTLGFTNAYDLGLRGGASGDVAREYANPQIPGTGGFALLLYGNFFVVSNSGDMLNRMVSARVDNRSFKESTDYATFERELARRTNAFVYVNAERTSKVLDDLMLDLQGETSMVDPEWAMQNRPTLERQVMQKEFPGIRDPARLAPADRQRFDEALQAEIQAAWNREKSRFIADDLQLLRERKAMLELFESAYAQFEFTPRSLQWTAGFLVDF